MKDKNLYQRRTDGDYKGYTEDGFYFNSTENYGAETNLNRKKQKL